MLEFQNIKTFLLKDIIQIGKELQRELQKTSQKQFRTEKVVKRKGDKLYVK